MTLLDVAPLGTTTPQIVHRPADVHSLDAAAETIELANAYGLAGGYPLDESQQFTLTNALGERADGSWSATTIADFEPRQNGKNDTIAARELYGLIVAGERLQIHTAHEFGTANESFLRLVEVFDAWDDLRRQVRRIRYANGEQGIELTNGARLKYKARTGGGVRGFAQADLVVYDEAQHLQSEHVAASGPARLANPNSQSWYSGSGGLSSSVNAWRMRRRALAGNAGRFAYVEHTAEQIQMIDGRTESVRPDVLDRSAWALANPAFGRRITEEALAGLFEELGPELFARECLCVWDPDPEHESAPWVLTRRQYEDGRSDRSHITDGREIALAVAPDGSWSSIAEAGVSNLGGVHGGVLRYESGTAWVVAEAARWGTVAVPKGSRAMSLVPELQAAGVTVVELSTAEQAAAFGQLADLVAAGQFWHPSQDHLDVAVKHAVLRVADGGAIVPSPKRSDVDVSPLVAVSLAVARHARPVVDPWSQVY